MLIHVAHSKQAWPGLAWPVWGWHVGCGMRSYHIRPYIFSRPDFGTNHLRPVPNSPLALLCRYHFFTAIVEDIVVDNIIL